MQTREKPNPFSDLHEFEKAYQHEGIKTLLEGYFDETELFPLLEYVDIDYKKQASLCDWNKDVIQPIEASPDENLIDYLDSILSIKAAPTLEQQIYLYNNIFNYLLSISNRHFDYFLLLGETCAQLARCHFQAGDYESAKMYQLSLLQIQIVCLLLEYKSLDGLNIAESFNYLGVIFCKDKMYELSRLCYEYALTAIDCMSGQQPSLRKAELEYNIGIIYFIQSGVLTYEGNQEDFSEKELENKHRLLTLADHYFMIALKQGVSSEKIEPKRTILAEAMQKEKAMAQLMESTVQRVIEGLYKKKLKRSISSSSLESISEVEELSEGNSILYSSSQKIVDPTPISKEVSKQNSSLSSGVNNRAAKTERKNAVDNAAAKQNQFPPCLKVSASSPRRTYLMTSPPVGQNYRPLLPRPLHHKVITLLPSPKSHYNGSSAFFHVGSPTAQSQSLKSDNRNVQHTTASSASNVSRSRS